MPPKTPHTLAARWHSLSAFFASHKVLATVIALVLVYGGYRGYVTLTAPSTATRYVTTTVSTGTVVASVSETGQVSASSNIDIPSKSSGEVLSLPVSAGQHVTAGTPLAYLDSTTAEQNVTSATQALRSAQIALATAEGDLAQTRASGYKDVANAFLNLPSVVSGLDTVLHSSNVTGHTTESNENAYANMTQSLDSSIPQLSSLAESMYQKAATSYAKASADFKATPRTASSATIDALITETAQAVADISDALRASTNFLDSVSTAFSSHTLTAPSTLTGNINSLTTYTTATNNYLTALASDVTNLASDSSLGTDPLVIQTSKLSVQMKQDALAQAEQALADTVVRAPFSGVVGKLGVQQYQTISTGASVATLVSDNQSVAISVNEVDAAKIKVGQKATITFDALPDVSIAGTVSSLNAVGTITSGVVSYAAAVTFDTPNASVKPGMSASTDIVTGVETGLVVPHSALKTANGQSYVQVFDPPLAGSASSTGATSSTLPTRVSVVTSLSDSTNTIIKKGLAEGDQIVIQTITGASATVSSAAQSTSVFGGARTGGNAGFGATRALTP
jgi:RND family efflux transporter MFP subunit